MKETLAVLSGLIVFAVVACMFPSCGSDRAGSSTTSNFPMLPACRTSSDCSKGACEDCETGKCLITADSSAKGEGRCWNLKLCMVDSDCTPVAEQFGVESWCWVSYGTGLCEPRNTRFTSGTNADGGSPHAPGTGAAVGCLTTIGGPVCLEMDSAATCPGDYTSGQVAMIGGCITGSTVADRCTMQDGHTAFFYYYPSETVRDSICGGTGGTAGTAGFGTGGTTGTASGSGAGGTGGAGGAGGQAILTVSAESVDLGTVDMFVPEALKTVTVTNVGTKTSGPLAVSVTGTGITATGCSGTTLAPQSTCTISITAAPEKVGAMSGTVSVFQGSSPPILIAVSAIATHPGLFTLTRSSLDLGKLPVKGVATGTVTMTSQAPAVSTGIVLTVTGTGFTLSPTTTCTDSLGAGKSCDIVVSFTAPTPGLARGTLTVRQGGETENYVTESVLLTATVQNPAKLSASPSAATMTAAVGASSSAMTFRVVNTGDVASGSPTIALDGANAADFSITGNSCIAPLVGGAAASCQLTVVFSPKTPSAANETATLTVTDSGPDGSSIQVALTGTVS